MSVAASTGMRTASTSSTSARASSSSVTGSPTIRNSTSTSCPWWNALNSQFSAAAPRPGPPRRWLLGPVDVLLGHGEVGVVARLGRPAGPGRRSRRTSANGISAFISATAVSRSPSWSAVRSSGGSARAPCCVMAPVSTRRRAGSQVGRNNRRDAPRHLQHPARALARRRAGGPRPVRRRRPRPRRRRARAAGGGPRPAPVARRRPDRPGRRGDGRPGAPVRGRRCTASPGLWTAATGDHQPRDGVATASRS